MGWDLELALADAAFHLPRKLEVGTGNDVTAELSAFQLLSQKTVADRH